MLKFQEYCVCVFIPGGTGRYDPNGGYNGAFLLKLYGNGLPPGYVAHGLSRFTFVEITVRRNGDTDEVLRCRSCSMKSCAIPPLKRIAVFPSPLGSHDSPSRGSRFL